MLPNFWNDRFDKSEYAYGTLPNYFLKEKLQDLKRGSILFPCEGEGRNAVYATTQAWTTYAFDFSEQGKKKAFELAKEHFVNFQYDIASVEDYSSDLEFDVVGLFFTHFPGEFQVEYYAKLISFLKEGGHLIGELFSEKQLNYQEEYNSGGPKDIDMLMSIEKMNALFPTIEFEILGENEVELKEGPYHQGKASTIRFLGKKTPFISDAV